LLGERDFLGKPVRQAVPEVEGQGFFELLDRVYQFGERYVAHQTPISVIRSEGRVPEARFLDFVYEPILGDDRQVTGIFVEGFDVTESYRAQEKLRELNQSLERRVEERTTDLRNIQTFYTHSSECHAILSRREDGRFQYDEINPATLRLYGMTRDQVIGRMVDEIFAPDVAKELSEHLSDSIRSNVPYRYSRKHGGSTIEAIATPIPAEPGTPPRLAVTARDITERQNLEEQLRQAQKMEAVGQLTGGIAHDFNNLLQGITGVLERAQHRIQQGRAAEADRFLNAALESANRAASLTHRLLAFSRRQTLDPTPTDANRLIAGMADLINRTMGPNIAVEVVGAAVLWLTRVDAPQLESALLNLSINARDAMPNGGKLIIETANKWLDQRAAKERDVLCVDLRHGHRHRHAA
jgi:PAS domain S-box-containing protein